MKASFITHAVAFAVFATGAVTFAQGPSSPDADPATKQSAPAKLKTSDSITVTAPGEIRAEQCVDTNKLIEELPGSSPISVLGRLPSVSVNSADPYGAYEWALRISIRGFNQNQLGFTLDEVPLGDMSYSNLNGLHISRAIIDENMGEAKLSQGTGALEIASNSNLGGAVQFVSVDPEDKLGFKVSQSFGSFNGHRTFARFDSGLLSTHTKFFLDGVYQSADKWKGWGDIGQRYFQVNTKLMQYIGGKGLLTFYVDWSNRQEVDYQDLNKVWAAKLGYKWDNFGNWAESIQAAYAFNYPGIYPATPYPSPVSTLNLATDDPGDAAYYGGSGLRKDWLTYLSYKQQLTEHLSFKVTGYGHRNDGRGLWFTPYVPSFDSTYSVVSPISLRTTEYGISRGGFLASVAYETEKNKLEGGVWFEKETYDLARRYYATSVASPLHSLYSFPSQAFWTQWSYQFPMTVFQFHLQDVYHATKNWTLMAGFKATESNLTGNLGGWNTGLTGLNSVLGFNYTVDSFAKGSMDSGKPFLPQLGANYKFNEHDELFADVAENVRAFQAGGPSVNISPWNTTSQAAFNALKNGHLKPESAWSEEIGYRHQDKLLQAQANYFHVNFSNRLLSISQGAGIAGNASILSNVGGVTTNGFDASGLVHITPEWSLYNAVTYSKSTYDSNYSTVKYDSSTNTYTTVTYNTGGKIVVDSPEFLYKDELSYSKHGLQAHIGADYMSKRYFTYINDNSVDGRFVSTGGASYTREKLGALSELKLQFNVYNLADARYYSSIGTNGFIASDPTSVSNNTLQVGAPRSFSGSFSVKF